MKLEIGKSYKTNIEITIFNHRADYVGDSSEIKSLWKSLPENEIFLVVDSFPVSGKEHDYMVGCEYEVLCLGRKYYIQYTSAQLRWLFENNHFKEVI